MSESKGKPPEPVEATDGKRRQKRSKRRIMVRYGTDAPDRTAFTKNLSEGGLYLHTNSVFRPGTTIQVQIQFPDRTFSHWARVRWAKQVPPQLAHVLDCGMGLEFIDPGPEWREFFGAWKKRSTSP